MISTLFEVRTVEVCCDRVQIDKLSTFVLHDCGVVWAVGGFEVLSVVVRALQCTMFDLRTRDSNC